MGFKPFKAIRLLARIGRPLLRLFGIRSGTVAEKAVSVAEIVEPILPPDEKSTK